jgi:hypothetical protein
MNKRGEKRKLKDYLKESICKNSLLMFDLLKYKMIIKSIMAKSYSIKGKSFDFHALRSLSRFPECNHTNRCPFSFSGNHPPPPHPPMYTLVDPN